MWLVVGLGNPGPEYAGNRHNVGFMVVDLLAERWQAGLRRKFGGELGQVHVHGERVALLKPLSFMNVSGEAVVRAAQFYEVEPPAIVVVHDDIDLELGRLKVKQGGGHGGHNGLRSIFQHLSSQEFTRVRLGVGRPPPRMDAADWVLEDFSRAERKEIELAIPSAADAVETILHLGVISAMNRFNPKAESAD
jgi:peptidyl-tRNA hydrolase, PTH1 family